VGNDQLDDIEQRATLAIGMGKGRGDHEHRPPGFLEQTNRLSDRIG